MSDVTHDEVTLFYNEFSAPSRKVLMALYEKSVNFVPRQIDLSKFEQHERWYLEINPRGEVPVLKHGDQTVIDSNNILEYIDKNFGRPNQLFPSDLNVLDRVRHFMVRVDSIPFFALTFGAVVFHTDHVTELLRFPFCRDGMRDKYRTFITAQPQQLMTKSFEMSDTPSGKILAEKSAKISGFSTVFTDLTEYQKLLARVGDILDEVEADLGSETHLGPWLCGATFSAADLCLVTLLLRLHQIGLDEKFWKHGTRPNISVYQEMAFKRPSFEQATKWSEHKNEVLNIANSSTSAHLAKVDVATVGLGALLFLGAAYAYKKFKH